MKTDAKSNSFAGQMLMAARGRMKKKIIFIRGAQGSGKTTLGNLICKNTRSTLIEADQFFTNKNGVYVWDKTKLVAAHNWCLQRFQEAVAGNFSTVVVANTFAFTEHIEPYIEITTKARMQYLSVCLLGTPYKNVHNVPTNVVEKCANNVRAHKLKEREIYVRKTLNLNNDINSQCMLYTIEKEFT